MIELPKERLRILLRQNAVRHRVQAMGAEISRDFQGEPVHFIAVLKGAVIFLSDLIRSVRLETSVDFIAVSSYGGETQSSGQARLLMDLGRGIEGRNVILVEDILDTGLTSNYLVGLLQRRGPKTLRIAVLLDKPEGRIQPIRPDYLGFRIPDRFVVGYGLDCAERFRNLRDIYVLDSSKGARGGFAR
ncbi:MAG: hypoxanthine phosphoribosyltransferase [Candidatus Acidiferrales bacterium]